MSGQMIDRIVIVDPNYGDRLEMTAQIAPVWMVASVDNRAACKRLWNAHSTGNHREKGAVTTSVTQRIAQPTCLTSFPP
jgi:hypothetical protein